MVAPAQAEDDDGHFQALQEGPLEGDDEPGGVPRGGRLAGPGAGGRREALDVLAEDSVLVVLGLEAHGPQHGFAQPLQPEDKQQRPHDGPQYVDGDQVHQGRP